MAKFGQLRRGNLFGALLTSALISAIPSFSQGLHDKNGLVDLGAAQYAPISRAAHVEGDVKLRLEVSADGRVSDVTALFGPKLLQNNAVEFARKWKFAPSTKGARDITIHYRLLPPVSHYNDEPAAKPPQAVIDPDGNVTVSSIEVVERSRSACPEAADTIPPAGEATDDYVELRRGACYGSCPAYELRVFRSGEVLWKPWSSVAEKVQEKKAQIASADAKRLLEAFRTPDFWGACGDYSRSITDSASAGLEVKLNGRIKTVSEYAESAPEVIHTLEYLVDEVTDSHRWRVGDPKAEEPGDIRSDGWLPKPGRTRLMAAADHGKAEDIEAALLAGDKVTDVDMSGWTPLMYAASSYGAENTKLLMDKGADPNTRGPRGETALMFSALSGMIDENLLDANADANAATDEGVTVLMLLAERGDPEELQTLIKAGAKANAKDKHGRTALDYLLAANCGIELVSRGPRWMEFVYGSCRALDADEFRRSRSLLELAGARQTQVWEPKPQ